MTFLKMATEDSTVTLEFIHGENSPFDISNIPEDEVVNKLTEDDDPTSDIIIPILQSMFHAFHGLLCRLIPEHLPGGIFDKPSDDLVEKTKSVMKHNKLPEFVFGQLDQLMRYMPNATILTNDSFITYSHNRTRNWLEKLGKDEREQLLTECRKEGRDIRQQFKNRI